MPRTLVAKIMVGREAPERCARAFSSIVEAVMDHADVSFWLAGEATWLALPGRAAEVNVPGLASLPDLLEVLMKRGRVTVCRGCGARRDITPGALLPGIRMAGAAVFVEECLAAEQAVVF